MFFVNSSKRLQEATKLLEGSSRIGVDTESNGFFVYYEKVCLIQISTTDEDLVIDPFVVPDLSLLSRIFRSPEIQKIFHGGDYDIVCLKRDFGFQFANIFDTALACRLLEGQEIALSKLLHHYFDVDLDKSYQRSDWGRRPLTRSQLEYAVLDSKYLVRMCDILSEQLVNADLWERSQEAFKALCRRTWTRSLFDPEGYRKIKGQRDLSPEQAKILRELYLLRDRWARRKDRPPFKIVGNLGLLTLARQQPATYEGIRSAKGFPRRAEQAMVQEIQKILVSSGQQTPNRSSASAPSRHRGSWRRR